MLMAFLLNIKLKNNQDKTLLKRMKKQKNAKK